MDFDSVVIGAGVVGLAIARSLSNSGRTVLLLEGENAVGQGISSRNSEVIHANLLPARQFEAGSLFKRENKSNRLL